MVRLSALIHSGFRIDWHEAVAVVQATAERCAALDAPVPTLDALALTPEGELTEALTHFCSGPRAPALAGHLRTLMEGATAPAELWRVLDDWEASTGARAERLDEFSRALAYFERPGRADVLRGLAARADTGAEQRAARELEHLTARARQHAATDSAVHSPVRKRRPWVRWTIRVVSVVLAVGLAVGALAWVRPEAARRVAGASSAAVVEGTARLRAVVRDGIDRLVQSVSPPAPAPEGAATASADTRAGSQPSQPRPKVPRPANAPDLVVRMSEQDLAGLSSPDLGAPAETAAPLPSSPSPPAETVVDTSIIYDASAEDVDPPALDRPALPTAQPGQRTGPEVGAIELLVGVDGRVERVRLVSPTAGFHERMLLSAAKAWRFRPAMKDGQPVRYLARVSITQ